MRILKLAALALMGYAVYELYQNLMAHYGQQDEYTEPAFDETQSFAERSNVTGPGEGMTVSTGETAGMSVPHVVGRGVVRR